MALASLFVLASAVTYAVSGRDQDSKIILGHHDCVMPRLVSVLVREHLEDRFAGAAEDVAVGDSVFPEGYYETS